MGLFGLESSQSSIRFGCTHYRRKRRWLTRPGQFEYEIAPEFPKELWGYFLLVAQRWTATCVFACQHEQLFGWLDEEGEIGGSPMAKMRPPKIPEKAVRVLPDDDVWRLLAECSGKDFRDRPDLAIIRLFLDTGMRLEGMAGLRCRPGDPEASDVDLRSRVVRITAKGRRELVLPIGAKSARRMAGLRGT